MTTQSSESFHHFTFPTGFPSSNATLLLDNIAVCYSKLQELPHGTIVGGIQQVIAKYAVDQTERLNYSSIKRMQSELMRLPIAERKLALTTISPIIANFVENEGSWRALEQLYSVDQVRFAGLQDVNDEGIAQAWFSCSDNARGVRERAIVTRHLINTFIQKRVQVSCTKAIRLASIASGSARCMIEAIHLQGGQAHIHASLLDWDTEALLYSEQLAKMYNVSEFIKIKVTANLLRIKQHFEASSLDLIEAVGIFDYLRDETLVMVLRQLRSLLDKGGAIIAANILPNWEAEFLHTAVGWRPMYYRSTEEFAQLFLQAGFRPEQCKVHLLPHGIYSIVQVNT